MKYLLFPRLYKNVVQLLLLHVNFPVLCQLQKLFVIICEIGGKEQTMYDENKILINIFSWINILEWMGFVRFN
jgi:hypothetical protein